MSFSVVIWAADCVSEALYISSHYLYSAFSLQNYRIDLTNDEVRSTALEGDIQTLWEADQLRLAMMHKDAFVDYEEARIAFLYVFGL